MKREGYIFEKIIDKENIKLAIKNASKGKTRKPVVIKVLNNMDKYVNKIYNILINNQFIPRSIFRKNNTRPQF